jgi:hypothetical protein
MDPLKVSAQFAAFVWASHGNSEKESARNGASRFARKNWAAFLPLAHEGLGRLLLKILAAKQQSTCLARSEPYSKTCRPHLRRRPRFANP